MACWEIHNGKFPLGIHNGQRSCFVGLRQAGLCLVRAIVVTRYAKLASKPQEGST